MIDQTILSVQHLTKNYGDFAALQNVSFEIVAGEFIGLIGPNGAGKTTLIQAITSQILFDEGKIEIGGLEISQHERQVKALLGYAPEPEMFPQVLNAYDILHFAADIREIQDKKEVIENLLRLTDLTSHAEKPIENYSTGMKQKLSLCSALIGNPKLIILDETLNGVDPVSSYRIKQHLKELTKQGKSILFSSHVLETIERYCDRIIVLHEGRIRKILTQDELKIIEERDGKDLEKVFIELISSEGT